MRQQRICLRRPRRAPFGSEESLLLDYSVKDVDFNVDGQVTQFRPTQASVTYMSWKYFTQHQQVNFNASDSSFAQAAHTIQ